MTNIQNDRRRSPRVPYGAWVEEGGEGKLGFYLAQNLSTHGMLLKAKAGEAPAIGHEVQLRLVIENDPQSMQILGEVVRHEASDAAYFAVRFVGLDADKINFLDALIAEAPEVTTEEAG